MPDVPNGYDDTRSPALIKSTVSLKTSFDDDISGQKSNVSGFVFQDDLDYYFFTHVNVTFGLIDTKIGNFTATYWKDANRTGRIGILPRMASRKSDLGKIIFGEPRQKFGFRVNYL